MQREQLEKIQVTIAEELRSTRNRLEVDGSNINALTSEVRQRTRKLEDDHRLTVRFQTNETIQKLKNILRMILYVNNKKLSMLAIFFSIHFAPHVIKSITNLFF
jgi:hypothetical protein